MNPLMQRPRPGRIGGEILDELRHARVAPGAAEISPDLAQRLRSEIAAYERQRVDQLDQTVGEHDKQCGRVLQSVAKLLEQSRLVKVDAHPAAILNSLLPQDVEEALVLLIRHLEVAPGLDRIAGVHRASGVE